MMFSQAFKTTLENGELDMDLFSDFKKRRMLLMCNSADDFYYERYLADKKLHELQREISEMKSSITWKVGHVITWLPRKLKILQKE